jgi:hypothetical protein
MTTIRPARNSAMAPGTSVKGSSKVREVCGIAPLFSPIAGANRKTAPLTAKAPPEGGALEMQE